MKQEQEFELDENIINGGLGGVNMGFGIPSNAFLGFGVKPYMEYINTKVEPYLGETNE